MRLNVLLLTLLLVSPVFGQEIPISIVGKTRVVTVVEEVPFEVVAKANGFFFWTYPPLVKAVDKGNILQIISAPQGESKVSLKLMYGVYDEKKKQVDYVTQFQDIYFSYGGIVPAPPAPPGPDPKPPEPTPPVPVPVTSFRVIFVYESGKLYTPQQISVMDSKMTRDYLQSNTTPEGGYAGYRKYDKDVDSSKDTPTINAMWTATKTLVTVVPCVAVEVNGNVDILPLSATPAEQVDVFKKYKSGVK